MTLSIDISTLRKLDELLPRYSDRDNLIDVAEFVAEEMVRARTEQIHVTAVPSGIVMKPGRICQLDATAPDIHIPQPDKTETQPEVTVAQPDQVKPQQEVPNPLPEPTKSMPLRAGLAGSQKPKDIRPGKCGVGRPWTDAEDMMLVRLKHSGMTWGAIGSELDRTSGSAEQRYIKLKKQGAFAVQKVPTPEPKADTPAPSPVNGANPSTPEIEPEPIATALETVSETARVSNLGDMSILKTRQRALVIHLANLSDDFAPIDDLDIVEGLMAGKKPTAIADELGCRSDDITKRWRAMLTADVVNRFGTPTIDGQQDVLTAARHLVKCAEARHG